MPEADASTEAGADAADGVARLAARQHGLITRPQLNGLGIDDDGVGRRVRKRLLHRVHQGVYAVGHPGLTREARWMAAVLACGPGSALSHLDAAALWQIYDGSGPRVHVLTKSNRRVAGICVHRARRIDPDDVTVVNGIPVTSVERTLVDLTDLLREDRVLRGLREAEYRRVIDHPALHAAVERARGRRHIGSLKRALVHHTPGQIVREELEHRFLQLLRDAGIPSPATNVKVKTRTRTYTVDCLWRDQRVAVELDGRAAHERAAAFEEDRERDSALSAIGLRPLRFTWRRVTGHPATALDELRQTLAQADPPPRNSGSRGP